MLRVAFYARVSTDEQVEGYSIHAQLKAMEEHAARQGWEVVARFVDGGESARTDNRPEFQRMVAAARRKPRPFDLVLVHKFDRFARNRDDSAIYKSLFRRECGIDVRSVTELTDNTPSGRLLEGVLEVVAEFYSNNLSHEVLKGQRERALCARAMAAPAIGYVTGPDGRYQADPATAAIVRWLYTEYARGDEGYRSLAQRMHTEGEARFGPVVGGYSWTGGFVRRILTNEIYCGTYIWGRRDSTKRWAERPRSEWVVVENAHEPLVSRELYDLVQSLRSSRHGVRRASPGEDYLLRGLARCWECGAKAIRYRYQWNDRKTGERIAQPSLICGAYSKGKGCYCNRLSMQEAEQSVLGYLRAMLQESILPDQIAVVVNRPQGRKPEHAVIARRLDSLEKRLQRLLDGFAAGAVSLEELKAARERALAERSALARQQTELEAEGERDPEAVARAVRQRIAAILDTATDPEQAISQRRAALGSIVDAVYLSRKQGAAKILLRSVPLQHP